MTEAIKAALVQMDKTNDDHWTADGLPRMDVLQKVMNDETVTRKMVTDADPQFTRETLPDAPDDGADEIDADVIAKAAAELPERAEAPEATGSNEPKEDGDKDVEWLLASTRQELFKSVDTMQRAHYAISVLNNKWTKEIDDNKRKIANMGNLSGRLSRAMSEMRKRLAKAGKLAEDNPIQNYLRQQAVVRAERAARAKAFMAQGINPKDIVKVMSGKSQLDMALNQRKAAPGSTRPDPRMPVRGTRQAEGR